MLQKCAPDTHDGGPFSSVPAPLQRRPRPSSWRLPAQAVGLNNRDLAQARTPKLLGCGDAANTACFLSPRLRAGFFATLSMVVSPHELSNQQMLVAPRWQPVCCNAGCRKLIGCGTFCGRIDLACGLARKQTDSVRVYHAWKPGQAQSQAIGRKGRRLRTAQHNLDHKGGIQPSHLHDAEHLLEVDDRLPIFLCEVILEIFFEQVDRGACQQ